MRRSPGGRSRARHGQPIRKARVSRSGRRIGRGGRRRQVDLVEALRARAARRRAPPATAPCSSRCMTRSVAREAAGQVEDVAGGSSGSARARPPVASAHQIGKSVMTGPAGVQRDARPPAICAAERLVASLAVSRDRAPNVGRSATREQERAGDRQRRAEPGHRLRPAAPLAEPDDPRVQGEQALMISRTWTGPAAWRNVPHVVATGNSEARDDERDGAHEDERPQRRAPRRTTAGRRSPITETGNAGQQQDGEQVVPEALDPHLQQPRRALTAR